MASSSSIQSTTAPGTDADSVNDDDCNDSNDNSRLRCNSSGSVSLNDFDDDISSSEIEGIALLRQIFQGESTEELKQIHQNHVACLRELDVVATPPQERRKRQVPQPQSALGIRVFRSFLQATKGSESSPECRPPLWQVKVLPHDFLRLPPHVAVRRLDEVTGKWRYELLRDLENQVIDRHQEAYGGSLDGNGKYITATRYAHPKFGLGLTLCESNDGRIRVHSFNGLDGEKKDCIPSPTAELCTKKSCNDIQLGDELIGVNGIAILAMHHEGATLLRSVVAVIRSSPEPVVLHLLRSSPASENDVLSSWKAFTTDPQTMTLTLDGTSDSSVLSTTTDFSLMRERTLHSTPALGDTSQIPLIHPFATVLRARGLLQSFEEERTSTLMLTQFTERTRQWESASSLRFKLEHDEAGILIPLIGVRKALSVRILNVFFEGSRAAYSIWVCDVETGKDFFSPVRYYQDFRDLRSATLRLYPPIARLPFPSEVFSILGSPVRQESERERDVKCRQLENFLRSLCSMIYREQLHPAIAEIAVHVQSFLGCDTVNLDSTSFLYDPTPTNTKHEKLIARSLLKRSLQLYTHRLFLLDCLISGVQRFVDALRDQEPRLEVIEALEAQGRNCLKERSIKVLDSIKVFLDLLQSVVLEGCHEDFLSIASRWDCKTTLFSKAGLDQLFRESVREQVEVEVYMPLRSIVSRWIVNGWRHEDMEVQFKIKELRRRSLRYFRIPAENVGETDWISVSHILTKRVGRSNLPCTKLRAIADAARELSRLYLLVHEASYPRISCDASISASILGADDFLPIFIYCVVQAELERPCALCVLLRNLCDPICRMGEIGYYLASFEAAIAHIQEVDLSDGREDLLSFLPVPLSGSPT